MAMYKFTLTGVRKGKTLILLDKYHFVDGEMVVTGKDAKLMKPILVDYFACNMEKVKEPDSVDADEEESDED